MGLNITGLTDYINQLTEAKINTALEAPTAAKLAAAGAVRYGVKSQEALNKIKSNITFADDACGVIDESEVIMSQRVLSVAGIAVSVKMCPKDLEKKFTAMYMSQGSEYNEVAFGDYIVQSAKQEIKGILETAIFQGDSASADANLNKFDGFLKQVESSAAQVLTLAELGITGPITKANVVDALHAAILSVPAKVKNSPDFKVFMGNDIFDMYKASLFTDKYPVLPGDDKIAGTNVGYEVTPGLDDSKKLFMARYDNMVYGTDGQNEEETLEFIKDPVTKYFYLRATFKAGTQVAWIEEAYVADLNVAG